MTDQPHVPFTPPSSGSSQEGTSVPKRSHPAPNNRNRGNQRQNPLPPRYEDEPDDPWAQQHDLPESQDSSPKTQDHAHPHHHLKIEFPPAFEKLGVEPAILHSLADIHFSIPSEIQEKMIPVALTGVDVLGQARTGTGKTAAFGIPILQQLDLTLHGVQVLIIVPTRELAVQVEAEMRRFAKHKPIRFALAYGGTKIAAQLKSLGHQPHVVVGTPGRIMDMQERGALVLNNVRFVVCDEVDRMFDIGFRDDIRKILSFCTAKHQTYFVSATISDDIERMVSKHMTNPTRIFTSNKQEQLTTPDAVQHYIAVEPWDKQRAIKMLMRTEKPALAIIFCRTKRSVDKVAEGLERDGIAASPIHGDLMQNKREKVMRGFKTGKIHVLVATDLASRGIDVHEITHVVNYDIPEDPEVYVHRVGRTARIGATGRAFTFISRGQGQLQTEIEKLINNLLIEYKIEGFNPSPEPNRTGNPGSHPHENEGQSSHPGSPAPTPPTTTEGYMPTSFTNVASDPNTPKSVRPLSGKFPSKRRR